jgi:hypothetical protein
MKIALTRSWSACLPLCQVGLKIVIFVGYHLLNMEEYKNI